MSTPTQLSYCTVCDALPGECEHEGAARYLEDVVYEKVENEKGDTIGWNPPTAEREDWERRREAIMSGLKEPRHVPGSREAESLPRLVAQLEAELDLDSKLEARFREQYARDPVKATALAERVRREARLGKIDRPEAFLAWRLKELAGEAT